MNVWDMWIESSSVQVLGFTDKRCPIERTVHCFKVYLLDASGLDDDRVRAELKRNFGNLNLRIGTLFHNRIGLSGGAETMAVCSYTQKTGF